MDRLHGGKELCSICRQWTIPNEDGNCPCSPNGPPDIKVQAKKTKKETK